MCVRHLQLFYRIRLTPHLAVGGRFRGMAAQSVGTQWFEPGTVRPGCRCLGKIQLIINSVLVTGLSSGVRVSLPGIRSLPSKSFGVTLIFLG